LTGLTGDVQGLLEMVRPSQDPRFGDYQANMPMPLGKQLGRPPREVAGEIVARLDVADFCLPPEIAGPGFINLRLRDEGLAARLAAALADDRLGVAATASPWTFVIDYSAPNVAKPMHVGHIRSTVIGDSLCRTLQFLGHTAISDNHLGDWGTQFGMILYGYKHFLDPAAYRNAPVQELARLYRLVRRVMEYYEDRARLPELEAACNAATSGRGPANLDKKARKALDREAQRLEEARGEIEAVKRRIAAVESDDRLMAIAVEHPGIGESVLAETAKLHAGDAENLRLWREFMPCCLEEIERMYRRLGVRFDHTLGESSYQDRCGPLVAELLERGIATQSEGAACIFLDGQKVPMIVRKQDGAFLYATTDLATLRYRMETWRPQAILYVVDHRQ
jgi:arginyl-tRNA synthetase